MKHLLEGGDSKVGYKITLPTAYLRQDREYSLVKIGVEDLWSHTNALNRDLKGEHQDKAK